MFQEQRFVRLDGEVFGPMSLTELAQLRAAKALRSQDAISRDGVSWTQIATVPSATAPRWWFPWVMTAAMVVLVPAIAIACVGVAAIVNRQLYPAPANVRAGRSHADDKVAVATWQLWTAIHTALGVHHKSSGDIELAMQQFASELDRLSIVDVDPQGIGFVRRLSAISRRTVLLAQFDDGTGEFRRTFFEGVKDLPTHLTPEQKQQLRDFAEEMGALKSDAKRLKEEFQQHYGYEFYDLEL